MMHSEDQISGAEEEQEQLGRRLRESREYIGLSQEFVAERLGIPRASISAMETGKRKVSSLELKHLAHLYKRSVTSLLGEDTQEEQAEDATVRALFRTARELSEQDRQQLLRFAQFLRQVGHAPQTHDEMTDRT
ncbi:MAG: helix-turn-helix transcriptional regulator [Ktedonobacteraceae bacterium]|nr:helix-turn-helix transcriptional regulator [Ktedonobacteraceae bacterium]